MQRTKKAICLLLSLLLALSCFTCLASVTAFAADGDTSIVYGDVDGDGVVKINDRDRDPASYCRKRRLHS